jgi:hypothetical protein
MYRATVLDGNRPVEVEAANGCARRHGLLERHSPKIDVVNGGP